MQFLDALGEWSARSGPLYVRLASAIGDAIARGDIPPGRALPSERSLAGRLAIGRTTVTGAYAQLRQGNLGESRRGSGTWARGAARAASGEPPRESLPGGALRDAAACIDLATAALPAPRLLQSLRESLATEMAGVPDSPGYLPALRQARSASLSAVPSSRGNCSGPRAAGWLSTARHRLLERAAERRPPCRVRAAQAFVTEVRSFFRLIR
jgi:DNA-binding transcriptional MocR family regulator